ncbi:MAG: DUF2071 domain-containing protein, partial [Acidobacteriota bacterium]|nr:DUF2071 domain-containing protein [Acidobacteriota bacterium]
LVSVVGFMFTNTRVRGISVPFHRDFEEVNLRFYVRREVDGEVRRGVVFVKEIVPRRAIAAIARLIYGENYVALPMDHAIEAPADSGDPDSPVFVEYRWKHGSRWNELSLRTTGRPDLPVAGSEEEFVTEHYWGYARQRRGGTVEYRVEHPRWRVWRAASTRFDADVAWLYGEKFAEPLSASPVSAFLAEGSAVIVRRGARL